MLPLEKPNRSFALHPHKIIVYLLIAGITMLFLSLTMSYAYTRFQFNLEPIRLPVIFFFNTVLLIASSYLLWKAKKYYEKDETSRYKSALFKVIGLTLAFLIGQAIGWSQLLSQEINVAYSNAASYLYLISGVHFLHVLAGLPFLVLFYIAAVRRMVEPVGVLLYFSDPEKRMRLHLLGVYWHFLDALWIYLITFFAANYLL
ncbi:MAG: cytochrome c oxidase subunit III [Saprospiraceae bacterium]|nr:cytochrome c oxidase subunit III [Saprospiraceae bacterium]